MARDSVHVTGRRSFLKQAAAMSGAAMLGAGAPGFAKPVLQAGAATAPASSRPIGLELWTVRDRLKEPGMREETLRKVAAMGFKEIEPDHGPSGGYLGLSPKDFRALLDRLGLSMPSTHLAVPEGPGLEKQLEGFQVMGLKYIVVAPPGAGVLTIPGQLDPAGTGPAPSSDQIKRDCDQLNRYGAIAKKFGMKVIIHNHTTEFAPLADNQNLCAYDLFIRNTDPAGVVLQLDIGWAAIAGQDIVELFKKAPGRYELWHVKDASNINLMPKSMSTFERRKIAQLVPVGLGDVDYKTIFANASLAGLKHFCVEQDNAGDWGDSMAAARVSHDALVKMFAA